MSSLLHTTYVVLWRAVYTPGDRQTRRVYSTTLVQYLYINCYLFSNKSVLSYLLLRLLPQCNGCVIPTVRKYCHPTFLSGRCDSNQLTKPHLLRHDSTADNLLKKIIMITALHSSNQTWTMEDRVKVVLYTLYK
jgi:hypothetical protein